ncbi:membrane-bound lytic murein transglycosylase F precursor [bacterium BMS3Abin11]|nr:membrane-bound lytic murein transglycosylase F precursor [bacterium BMS3Abin11]GMT39731.1 MAG: membrane-bound lytic murein transglycosylase F [bacterium]
MSEPNQQKKRLQRIRIIGILVAVLLSIPVLILEFTWDENHLQRILSAGKLRVITFNGPTTYYEDNQGKGGFEYELARAFANNLGVELEIRLADQFDKIMPELKAAHVDMAAAGLTITEDRKKQFSFSAPYQTIKQQVIFRGGGKKRPHSAANLVGRNIMITSGSSHVERLEKLKEKYPELSWQETADETPENLLIRVWEKKLDLTVADSNIVAVVRQYYPDLNIAFSLPPDDKLAWMFTFSSDHSLIDAANDFLKEMKSSGKLDRLLDRYYGPSSKFNYVNTKKFLERIGNLLPEYEDMFRRAGEEAGIDWRLLAAQAYQESHWNADAVSPTGVRGIMMLTNATAKRLKISDRRNPEESIEGGSRYLKLLIDSLPTRIPHPDRLWFALAAYNIGIGHLEDARILTQKAGDDPDSWLDVRKYLPLLARPEWHKKTRYGYARGYEPVAYVNRIRSFYAILSWSDAQRKRPVDILNNIDLPAL